jgi:myo-inositol-1(or 4)-monophosphatase
MTINNEVLLEVALNAANKAKIIAYKYRLDSKIISSEFKDIKTLVDIEMNETIISYLKSTGIPILSEESEKIEQSDIFWIVDPLDGTLNFTRGYGCFSISISLWKGQNPELGVVYDIFNNRVYKSINHLGAKLDKLNILVSKTSRIQDAILATGFPSGADYQTNILLSIVKKIQVFKKIRAIGSASIMLSYVASGVFDVYYEKDIYLWDVAAGLSLVKEAGGKYFMRATDKAHKFEVLASNKILFEECKSILF